MTGVLVASRPDPFYARRQMALSLGSHIVIACLAMAFPFLVVLAEWRGNRTGDAIYTMLEHQLRIDAAAAPRATLQAGLVAFGVGSLFLVPAPAWLFVLFQRGELAGES